MTPLKGTGMGRQLLAQVSHASLATDLLYSFIIIAIGLMIYFGTKELYNLSSHKGIKYFRLAFLFFSISFFFRSFIKLFVVFFDVPEIFYINMQFLGTISLFIFMYSSSIAIFYLLYSVMWKKWNGDKILLFHILAIIVAVIVLIIKSHVTILLIHLILFIFISIITYISYKNSKKKRKGKHLHGIYILLFAFWILNILDIVVPNALQTFQLLIYLASIGVFLSILYKVLKRLGA